MKLRVAGAWVIASLVTACASPGAAGRAPPSDAISKAPSARESLRAADAALADALARRGSAEALAAAATSDAALLVGGHYALRGPEAIRAHLSAQPFEKDGALSAQALLWDVSADGSLGFTLGQMTVGAGTPPAQPTTSGTPATPYFRYLAAWTRTAGGPWKLAAAVVNRAASPLTVPPGYAIAPAAPPPDSPSPPADVLAEAFAADSAFSDQSTKEGMGRAFIAWAAPDAVIPGGPTGNFGLEGLTRTYAPITRDKVDLRWEPRLGGAAASGDLAYTVGRGVSVAPGPDGKTVTTHPKYLSIWRRQADGQWRYVADFGNGSPGPDGP